MPYKVLFPYQHLNSRLAGDFRSPTSRLAGDQKVSYQPAGRRHFLLEIISALDKKGSRDNLGTIFLIFQQKQML